MDGPNDSSDGLLNTLRRMADNVLGLAQDRVELLSLELHEEKYRLLELVGRTFLAVSLGLMALILVSFTIVVLFWDSARVTVLVLMSVLYIGATAWAYWKLRTRVRVGRRPLADSLNELKKDRECLQTKN
jgi:uncharacterized membrane protein YqjE